MNLHEYQAKALLQRCAVPLLPGALLRAPVEAEAALAQIGGVPWVAKVQVHAGGRGAAGGVQQGVGVAALADFARHWLGQPFATVQTGSHSLPVTALWVEPAVPIARELYLAFLLDRAARRITILASASGGMSIETLAQTQPESIYRASLHPATGLQTCQARRLGFSLGLDATQTAVFTRCLQGLWRAFAQYDLLLAEINPLAVLADGRLMVLDAKLTVDDNALYRQPELAALHDSSQEDPAEHQAALAGLNYITLDGDIACMVNGAGLAMATMDLIQYHGGQPANFLDVGGTTTAERVATALRLILGESRVKAILVNIFGGIVRCDLIAEGIIQALHTVEVRVPVIVRLEGTNAEQGRALLAQSGLALRPAADLTHAAQLAVAAARGELVSA
jgi:succinyl-CoA synthetase beta subunit